MVFLNTSGFDPLLPPYRIDTEVDPYEKFKNPEKYINTKTLKKL